MKIGILFWLKFEEITEENTIEKSSELTERPPVSCFFFFFNITYRYFFQVFLTVSEKKVSVIFFYYLVL